MRKRLGRFWSFLTILFATIAAAVHPAGPQAASARSPAAQADGVADRPAVDAQNGDVAAPQPVTVNVIVQDENGRPVRGLHAGDFRLSEDETPQTIQSFAENPTPSASPKAIDVPELPPGTFTNYTPMLPGEALDILLVDALNTPLKDQGFLLSELRQYANQANPQTRIAVLGLTNHLLLLQDFTSGPRKLKYVMDHQLIPRTSSPVDDASGPSLGQVGANVAEFETQMRTQVQAEMQGQMASTQMRLRLQYTLDAFNMLGHYLAAFPGRKNLIWFSSSFPLDVMPDGSKADPFTVPQVNEDEFRETAGLLTRAQVAIYPVDGRSPITQFRVEASLFGHGNARGSGPAKPDTGAAQQTTAMEQMAADSGGLAIQDSDSLTEAVAEVVAAGSDFYTLTYLPSNRKRDGSYRNIKVSLAGSDAARGFRLSYLRGYFAEAMRSPSKAAAPVAAAAGNAPASAGPSPADLYFAAAMRRGAPPPEGILFKVRVLPASHSTEAKIAEGNVLNPYAPIPGPYQRYDVDCASLARQFSLNPGQGERREARIEFLALLYDPDGKLLNSAGRTIQFRVAPDTYRLLLQDALDLHLEISAPADRETYLRIGLRDLDSHRMGAVEVPILDVSHLPPPASPAASPPPSPRSR